MSCTFTFTCALQNPLKRSFFLRVQCKPRAGTKNRSNLKLVLLCHRRGLSGYQACGELFTFLSGRWLPKILRCTQAHPCQWTIHDAWLVSLSLLSPYPEILVMINQLIVQCIRDTSGLWDVLTLFVRQRHRDRDLTSSITDLRSPTTMKRRSGSSAPKLARFLEQLSLATVGDPNELLQ